MPDFQVLSDLHLERGPASDAVIIPGLGLGAAPNLLLLGDLGDPYTPEYRRLLEAASAAHDRVFLVPGNHEYYNLAPDGKRGMGEIRSHIEGTCKALPNVTLLDEATADVEGVRLIGATLWSHVPPAAHDAVRNGMNDYRGFVQVRDSCRLRDLTPSDTNEMLRRAVVFAEHELIRAVGDRCPVLVATHHAPAFEVLHERHAGSPLNHAFATNLRTILDSGIVDAWAFGHTHHAVDRIVGRTRVLSNPLGYAGEATGFSRAFVFTVEARRSDQ